MKLTSTTSQLINLQSAMMYGSGLSLRYTPNKKVFGMLSYSYLHEANTSDNRTSDLIAYRPQNQLRAFISYMPIKYFGIDLACNYLSKRYYQEVSTVWQSLPDYATFDLGVSTKPIKYFTLWFKVNNLFDKDYSIAYDQPMPGREYRVGLNFDFSILDK